MLSFQPLDVYQRAIEFLALIYAIVEQLPKGHGDRADPLVRAAESVVRSIAEGAGPIELRPLGVVRLDINERLTPGHQD